MGARSFLFCLLMLFGASSFAQWKVVAPDVEVGWSRISIPGMGTIDIPPSVEVQDDEYRRTKQQVMERLFSNTDIKKADVIIQQRGLNVFDKEAVEQFFRLTVTSFVETPGAFRRVDEFYFLNDSELNFLSELFRSKVEKEVALISSKLLTWNAPELTLLNSIRAVHYHYKRTGTGNKPPVIAHVYVIENYDRLHFVEVAYRETESSRWEKIIPAILKSLRMTRIQ